MPRAGHWILPARAMTIFPPERMRLLALLPCLLLAACLPLEPGCTRLPEGVSYCLQPSASAPAFNVRQRVIAQFDGKRERVILEINNSTAGSHFAALSSFGHELLLARYDNREASAQRLPHEQLTAERAIALLQIVYWPAESVQRGLDDSSRIEERIENSRTIRRLLREEQVLLEADYDVSPTPYRHIVIRLPSYGMALDITTLAPESGGVAPN